MNRYYPNIGVGGLRVPHMRGDEPNMFKIEIETGKCSPHAWG